MKIWRFGLVADQGKISKIMGYTLIPKRKKKNPLARGKSKEEFP